MRSTPFFALLFTAFVAPLVSSSLVGCSTVLDDAGSTDAGSIEEMAAAEQNWVAPQNRTLNESLLGFENAVLWNAGSTPLGQSVLRTEGSYSLALSGSGWTSVTSQSPIGLGTVGDTLSYDLFLTNAAGWGETKIILRSPSQGLWWHEVGTQSLTPFAAGQWHTVQFPIDGTLATKLEAATDLEIQIVVNGPSGAQYLDRLDFNQPSQPSGSGGSGSGGSGSGGSAGGGADHATNGDILGFEGTSFGTRGSFVVTCASCSSAALALQQGPGERTEGSRSLRVTLAGASSSRVTAELTTPKLTKLDVVTDTIGFDLRMPAQASGSQFGQVQLFVTSAQAGVFNQWIGQKSLDGSMLYQGAFRRVQFPLPEFVRARLATGTYSDLEFRLVLNDVPVGSYDFDWLALREQFPPTIPPIPSQDADLILGMETLAGWDLLGANQVTLGDDFTEGSYSICVDDFSNVEFKSVNLSSLGVTNGSMSFDVLVPDGLTESETVGINAFISIPSQNVYKQSLGWAGVTGKPNDEVESFQSVTFTLPTGPGSLREKLETAGYGDLSVELAISTPRRLAGDRLCLDDVDFGHAKFADVGQGPTLTRVLDVDVPLGVSLENVALYKGQKSRRYRSGLGIWNDAQISGDVISTGWFGIGRSSLVPRPSTAASVENAYVRETADLRAFGTIEGDLFAQGPSTVGAQEGSVEGMTHYERTYQQVTNYRWNVIAPRIPADAPRIKGSGTLSPGVYGSLELAKNQTRTLGPGTYYFKKILLNGGTLRLDNDATNDAAADAIRIVVNGQITSTANVVADKPSVNNVWWVQLGTRNVERFGVELGNPAARSTILRGNFFGSVWAEAFCLGRDCVSAPKLAAGANHPRLRGAVFSRDSLRVTDADIDYLKPFAMGRSCGPCEFTLGCTNLAQLDADADGLSTCEEEADSRGWTDPSVFNGLQATVGGLVHQNPSAAALDTAAEVDATLAQVRFNGATPLVRNQYLGWDSSGPDSICYYLENFGPGWAQCESGTASTHPKFIQYRGALYPEVRGKHCFGLEALSSTSLQAASVIFVDGQSVVEQEYPFSASSRVQTGCVDLSAGGHEIRIVTESKSASIGVSYCFGGLHSCEPESQLPSRLLRPSYDPETDVIACDTDPTTCTETCPCDGYSPCSDENACTFDVCNYPSPGLNAYLPVALDDGLSCTIDTCDPVDGVKHTVPSDDDACTQDVCDPIRGELHLPFRENDGNVCTADSCTPRGGPDHSPIALSGECVETSACTVVNGQPDLSATFKAVGTPCGSFAGYACNGRGACVALDGQGEIPGEPVGGTSPPDFFAGIPRAPGACTLEALDPARSSVIVGRVWDGNLDPQLVKRLAGATISVVGECQQGTTTSAADGSFRIVVNGGRRFTVRVEMAGFLPSDRQVDVGWLTTAEMGDVALVKLSPEVLPVNTATDVMVTGARYAETSEDWPDAEFNSRQPSLFFQAGTTFEAVLPDGTIEPVTGATVNLRVTEYTQGGLGRQRMPAPLPPGTDYTYAMELSLDEADPGATTIRASKPYYYYVDNFPNHNAAAALPEYAVGRPIPSFYYDRVQGKWIRETDGVVVEVVQILNGAAVLHPHQADASENELRALVSQRGVTVGQQLWRVRLDHLSPHDLNQRVSVDCTEGVCPGAVATVVSVNGPRGGEGSGTVECGSIIEVEDRVLRESFPVAGTDLRLNYSSRAVLGYALNRTIPIVSDPQRMKLPNYVGQTNNVSIAGDTFHVQCPRDWQPYEGWNCTDFFNLGKYGKLWSADDVEVSPGLNYIEWFGRGRDGQIVYGHQGGRLNVTSWYVPTATASGGPSGCSALGASGCSRSSGGGSSGGRVVTSLESFSRNVVPVVQRIPIELTVHDAKILGLGGWTLDPQHVHYRGSSQIFHGDGSTAKALRAQGTIELAAEIPRGGTGASSPAGLVSDGAGGFFSARSSFANNLIHVSGTGALSQQTFPDGGTTIAIAAPTPGVVYQLRSQGSPPSFSIRKFRRTPSSLELLSSQTYAQYRTMRALVPNPEGGLFALITPDLAHNGDLVVLALDDDLTQQREILRIPTLAGSVNDASLATGPSGELYVAFYGNDSKSGVVRWSGRSAPEMIGGAGSQSLTVVGGQIPVDGLPATEVRFLPDSIAVTPDGAVVLTVVGSDVRGMIWAILPDGRFQRIAGAPLSGTETVSAGRRVSATRPNLVLPDTGGHNSFQVGVDIDGSLLVARQYVESAGANTPIWRVRLHEGGLRNEVVSPDASQLYEFHSDGRPKLVRDAKTRDVRYSFVYDSRRQLTALVFGDADSPEGPTIPRLKVEHPTVTTALLTAPDGQETEIWISAATGYARRIEDGVGDSIEVFHGDDGLLRSMTDRRGGVHTYDYDHLGRLTRDAGADGDVQWLDQSLFPDAKAETWNGVTSYEVAHTSADEEVALSHLERRGGTTTRSSTEPDGSGWSMVSTTDKRTRTSSDGTSVTETMGDHPVLGPDVSFVTQRTVQLPSGLTASETRNATVAGQANLVSIETTTRNGKDWVTTTNAINWPRVQTMTSPSGRQVTTQFDERGRILSRTVAGLEPIEFTYDGDRLVEVASGTRQTTLGYFESGLRKGYVEQMSPAEGPAIQFDRDVFGRATELSVGTNTTSLLYDEHGNLRELRTPTNRSHLQTFDGHDRLTQYSPPDVLVADAPVNFGVGVERDDTGRILRVRQEQHVWLQFERPDETGRVRNVTGFGNGTSVLSHGVVLRYEDDLIAEGKKGVLSRLIRGNATTDLIWDGPILKSESTSGLGANVALGFNVDNDFRVTNVTFTKEGTPHSTASYGYDDDGLITCVAPTANCSSSNSRLDYRLNAQNGLVQGVVAGSTNAQHLAEDWAFSAHGELTSQRLFTGRVITGGVVTSPGTEAFSVTYDSPTVRRDGLGRIRRRVIQEGSASQRSDYDYDDLGRLWRVQEGAVVTAYVYDANGNRLCDLANYAGSTPPETCGSAPTRVYDAQDRLLVDGDTEYSYSNAGTLHQKVNDATDTTTTYQYDAAGNLLQVGTIGVSTQEKISYDIDGFNRRIGKRVGLGTAPPLVKQYVWSGALRIEAELDGSGNVVSRFVYGSRPNVPELMVQAGETYRIVTDQLGSPLYIVNIHDASDVLLSARYDAWGNVTEYTVNGLEGQPWPVPFGFAGGLYDEDTGLVRFGARDYDPSIGRWLSKDPILFEGGQANLYVYVGNDPSNWTDPDGEIAWLAAIGAALLIGSDEALSDPAQLSQMEGQALLGATVLGAGASRAVATFAAQGRELSFGNNWRFAPFGNRTPHPLGRLPHYHRRGPTGPDGQTLPGQGIGRHRPWESKGSDKNLCDRF